MIQTKYWTITSSDSLDYHPTIIEAAQLLRRGEVVAFPTETVYGLGASARSYDAIAKIFQAKGRPADNPLIVHLYDRTQLDDIVAVIPEIAERLIAAFTPGPLTLIMAGNGTIATNATAGLASVAIRFPDHPVARALLKAAALPIAAPSANRSGHPSPTTAQHVQADLDGSIAGIIDAGATGVGVESTVLDLTTSPPVVLRPGAISIEELQAVIGTVALDPALTSAQSAPRSPGMKYRHYAPDAPLWIVAGDSTADIYERVHAAAIEQLNSGKRVGILTTAEGQAYYAPKLMARDVVIEACGSRDDLPTVARALYDRLRSFNAHKVDIIFAEAFPNEGIGLAIMNRLDKAAGGRRR